VACRLQYCERAAHTRVRAFRYGGFRRVPDTEDRRIDAAVSLKAVAMRSPSAPRLWWLALSLLGVSAFASAQVASFTYSPPTPTTATPVNFADTSEPSPTSWSWDFGDPDSDAANTSTAQNPTHTFSHAGQFTVTLTITGGNSTQQVVTVTQAGAGSCVSSLQVLCLDNNRFQVTANWTKATGETGAAYGVKLTDASGYFWFFECGNVEMVVKVLNGCAINDAYWVFAAGLTNVQVNWLVTDTTTGATYVGDNPQGTAFVPIQETRAFPNACP
jgi:PKD domain